MEDKEEHSDASLFSKEDFFPAFKASLEQLPPEKKTQKKDPKYLDRDLTLNAEDLKKSRYRSDTKNRAYIAWTVIGIIIVWLVFVGIILCLNHKVFQLSDTVLVALLTSTTVTVLGLPAIVLRGFFQYMDQNTKL